MLKNFWANYNGFSVLMAKLFWRENKNSIVYKFSLEVQKNSDMFLNLRHL